MNFDECKGNEFLKMSRFWKEVFVCGDHFRLFQLKHMHKHDNYLRYICVQKNTKDFINPRQLKLGYPTNKSNKKSPQNSPQISTNSILQKPSEILL